VGEEYNTSFMKTHGKVNHSKLAHSLAHTHMCTTHTHTHTQSFSKLR
jgi:hypothetical protein